MPLFTGRPTVIGHRGSGAQTPGGLRENTLRSFEAVVRAGLDWVELDVHRCADGLVLLHDPLHGALDGAGGYVVDRTVEELRADGVDDLAAAFAALPVSVGVDVDVKSSLEDAAAGPGRSTAAVLAPLLELERARRPLLATSFDPAVLLELRALAPGVPLGLLTWHRFPPRIAVAAAARLGLDVLAMEVTSFGALDPGGRFALRPDVPQVLDAAHAAGLEVAAWCPDAAVTQVLVEAGVDAVIVDHRVDHVPAAPAQLPA